MRIALLASTALCLATASSAQAPAPAYQINPDFQKLRQEAIADSRTAGNQVFAGKAWAKANKVAGGHCMECFEGIVNADWQLDDMKHAMQTASEMDAAGEKPIDHVKAELLTARTALLASHDVKKPNIPMLEQAHTALLKAEPLTSAAYFYDGRVLSMLKRDADAGAAFEAFVQRTRKDDPLLVRAHNFAAHPELAREQMAPALVVTTLSGKHFNLDDMHGRVVLIDFWATWCGPCKQELPHMKKLVAQYADAPFELISISWDSKESDWKDFIATNGMTWNQYRDVDHSVTKAFAINAIPHYFTIDSNGVLTAENLGSGSNIDGRIAKLVAKARESTQVTAPVSSAGKSGD